MTSMVTKQKLAHMRALQGKRGFWYLSSPYSKYAAGREAAFREASNAAAWLRNNDVVVFASIPHSHPIGETGLIPYSDEDLWTDWGKRIYVHSIGIVVLQMQGYQESTGVNLERKDFAEMHKEEVLLPWPQPGV